MKPPWLQAKPKSEQLGVRLTRAAMGAAALALLVAALIFNSYHYASRRAEMAERKIAQAEAQAAADVKAAAVDLAAQAAEAVLAARLAGAKSDPLTDAAISQLGSKLQ